jgi:hypothetical protein
MLSGPAGIALDSLGNILFTEQNNQRLRKINTTGYVRLEPFVNIERCSTVGGNGIGGNLDGQAPNVQFNYPGIGNEYLY